MTESPAQAPKTTMTHLQEHINSKAFEPKLTFNKKCKWGCPHSRGCSAVRSEQQRNVCRFESDRQRFLYFEKQRFVCSFDFEKQRFVCSFEIRAHWP